MAASRQIKQSTTACPHQQGAAGEADTVLYSDRSRTRQCSYHSYKAEFHLISIQRAPKVVKVLLINTSVLFEKLALDAELSALLQLYSWKILICLLIYPLFPLPQISPNI